MTDAPRPKSFQDILQQNQDFIAHLQTLQDDVASQLTDKEKELAATRAQLDANRQALDENQKELAAIRAQLDAGQRAHGEKQKELDDLQNAQLEWAMDRESLLKDRDATVRKQAELEQEWQKARAVLTDDKNRLAALNTQINQQLRAVQAELDPLKAAREKWQAERQRLIADVARLEQESQAKDSEYRADRKLLQTDLDEARKKAAELGKVQGELQRLGEERTG